MILWCVSVYFDIGTDRDVAIAVPVQLCGAGLVMASRCRVQYGLLGPMKGMRRGRVSGGWLARSGELLG